MQEAVIIKKIKPILFLLIAASLVIISGCSKAECKISADCIQKTCGVSKCEDKKCVYTPQSNCCGNGIKDPLENGRTGNQCSCPQDYGKCEGKAKVIFRGKEEDAQYAHYFCDFENKCALGVERKDIASQNFLDTMDAAYFKASSVLRYNKPFDMKRDTFEIKLTLDDAPKDLVLPIKITGVNLLFTGDSSRSELLIAEKKLDRTINNVDDSVTISVPLNLDYKPQEVEESGSFRYTIDYTHSKKVPDSRAADGTIIYKTEQVRDKFFAPAKQVFLVRT